MGLGKSCILEPDGEKGGDGSGDDSPGVLRPGQKVAFGLGEFRPQGGDHRVQRSGEKKLDGKKDQESFPAQVGKGCKINTGSLGE